MIAIEKHNDDYQELFDTLVNEMMEISVQKMNQTDPELARKNKHLTACSQKMLQNERLDSKTKSLLDDYTGCLQLISHAQQKHLYLQGAKDFVMLLRKFDVIR